MHKHTWCDRNKQRCPLAILFYLCPAAVLHHTALLPTVSNNHASDFAPLLLSMLLFFLSHQVRISYGCYLPPSPSSACTLPPHTGCCIKPHSKLSVQYKCFLIDSNCDGTKGADIRKRKSTTFMNNAPRTKNLPITQCMGIIHTAACY